VTPSGQARDEEVQEEVGMCGDLGALTAEDWQAARRSLGRGSWSLLTGTSTRALDIIAQSGFEDVGQIPQLQN
jgi:hypothetical protein